MGPILNLVLVVPLLDLEQLFAFADNAFLPRIGVIQMISTIIRRNISRQSVNGKSNQVLN
jgi:hypothetical protein